MTGLADRLGAGGRDRGQLVLMAAAIVALAVVVLLFAYLQLGYAADVRAAGDADPAADARTTLVRAVANASDGVPRAYPWAQRGAAVRTVRSRLADPIRTVERARVTGGVARSVEYNGSRASEWASESCPGGRGRAFGPCVADGGIVVQERDGDTHVVAVAVDVRATGERERATVTTVIERP